MGISYNPSVISDGMVLYLDAASLRSYPRSGSICFDLSNRQNHGTIQDVIFSTENNGSFGFDAVTNKNITIPFNNQSMDFSLAQTICMWFKPTNPDDGIRRNPYNQAYGGPGTLTYERNRIFNYYFGTNGGNGTPWVGLSSPFTVSQNELAFITVSRSQPNNRSRWYKNGILIGSGNAGGYVATANGSSNILIGTGYAGRFIGNIYNIAIYNIELTEDQVRQNFEAHRGRFGL